MKIRGAAHGDQPSAQEVARHRDEHARAWTCTAGSRSATSLPVDALCRHLHQYLVLRGGIRVEEGFTGWCHEVLGAL